MGSVNHPCSPADCQLERESVPLLLSLSLLRVLLPWLQPLRMLPLLSPLREPPPRRDRSQPPHRRPLREEPLTVAREIQTVSGWVTTVVRV